MSKGGDMYEMSKCIYINLDEKSNALSIRIASYEYFDFINIPFYYIFKILGI